MGKSKAQAHHTSTYFHMRRVSISLSCFRNPALAGAAKYMCVKNICSLNEEIKYIMKIKIHCSCEIEYFVGTHLRKLCVILRSRVLRVVCPH